MVMSEYDSPWKESLEVYFESFLDLCFPAVHQELDWSKGYVSRDKELQKLLAESETGKRIVDKLIQVWRKSGAEAWILIHVEVQSQPETRFVERISTTCTPFPPYPLVWCLRPVAVILERQTSSFIGGFHGI
jgi:hypothetical protein